MSDGNSLIHLLFEKFVNLGRHSDFNDFLNTLFACLQIILPVRYHDKWSCYFWDLKYKTLTIMDPSYMKSSSLKVSLHHEQAVSELHQALLACINHFFDGWSVDDSGWRFFYPTNHGPRCKAYVNSGLYADVVLTTSLEVSLYTN